jgi:hypothetical protein
MVNASLSLRYRNSSNDAKEPQLTDRILAVSLAGKLPLEVVSQNSPSLPPPFPLNPRNVLLHYSKYLLDHERTEILDYEHVYYIDTRYPKL